MVLVMFCVVGDVEASPWFFIWSSGELTRESSNMWGRLYTYICSYKGGTIYPYVYGHLTVLLKLCPSLPTMLMLSSVVGWSVVDWWPYMGGNAFRCFLNLFMKCSSGFSYVFIITVQPIVPIPVYYATFSLYCILVLRWCKDVLECSVAIEICIDAILAANVLNTFTWMCYIWYNNVPLGFD